MMQPLFLGWQTSMPRCCVSATRRAFECHRSLLELTSAFDEDDDSSIFSIGFVLVVSVEGM